MVAPNQFTDITIRPLSKECRIREPSRNIGDATTHYWNPDSTPETYKPGSNRPEPTLPARFSGNQLASVMPAGRLEAGFV